MNMTRRAKEYMNAVSRILVRKYGMTEIEAYKVIRNSFLYDSLLYYVDETIHDDVEMNADAIYEDIKNAKRGSLCPSLFCEKNVVIGMKFDGRYL